MSVGSSNVIEFEDVNFVSKKQKKYLVYGYVKRVQQLLPPIIPKLVINKIHEFCSYYDTYDKVIQLNNDMVSEFENILSMSVEHDLLIVINFYATWCGPSKFMSSHYLNTVKKYPISKYNVLFFEIDVDKFINVTGKCKVLAFPTFQFYKNKQKIHSVLGMRKDAIAEFCENYFSHSVEKQIN
eukprot:481460_1